LFLPAFFGEMEGIFGWVSIRVLGATKTSKCKSPQKDKKLVIPQSKK